VNVLAVYVLGIVVLELMNEFTFASPYVPIQLPPIAKHPLVILNPTLDVDVADPEIDSPDRVVVPKPELDTVNHGFVVLPTHSEKLSPATELIARRALGEDVDSPTLPVKLFVFENVLKSDSRVDEAAVSAELSTYTVPDEFVFRNPAVVVDSVTLPAIRLVVLAVINDE
jgi:hypothetical protein